MLTLVAGRVVADTIQQSLAVDQNMPVSTATKLDRKGIEKALSAIGEVPQQAVVEAQQASQSGTSLPNPQRVEIVNASGRTGGAKAVSELFPKEIDIDLKTNESLLDETTIFYKNEYRQWEESLRSQLEELGWDVDRSGVKTSEDAYDITIVLGETE